VPHRTCLVGWRCQVQQVCSCASVRCGHCGTVAPPPPLPPLPGFNHARDCHAVHAELVIVAWHVLCCLTRRATAGPRAVDWDRWIKGWMDGWMDTVGPILRVDFWKASSIGHWWVRWVYSAAEPRGAWRPWSLLREGCAAGGLVTPRDHCGRARGDAFERLSHRVLLVCWLWNQSWVRAHIDAPSPPPPASHAPRQERRRGRAVPPTLSVSAVVWQG
jgi:hypothetical protein